MFFWAGQKYHVFFGCKVNEQLKKKENCTLSCVKILPPRFKTTDFLVSKRSVLNENDVFEPIIHHFLKNFWGGFLMLILKFLKFWYLKNWQISKKKLIYEPKKLDKKTWRFFQFKINAKFCVFSAKKISQKRQIWQFQHLLKSN